MTWYFSWSRYRFSHWQGQHARRTWLSWHRSIGLRHVIWLGWSVGPLRPPRLAQLLITLGDISLLVKSYILF